MVCYTQGVPPHFGAWLSLVERLVRDQEAGGSNPLAPTKHFLKSHLSKLHEIKFRDSSVRRRTPTRGVTLVAYWQESQPPPFRNLIGRIESRLHSLLDPGWFHSYAPHVHATIIGLEARPADSTGLLNHFQQASWPLRIQIGGYAPEARNPLDDAGRRPYARTFEIREDGLMVLMGWPLDAEGQPFAPSLLDLRRGTEPFGVVHKWHLKPGSRDNDLFLVVGEVNYAAWDADREKAQQALDEAETMIRRELAEHSVDVPLGLEHLSVIGYANTMLSETWRESPLAPLTPADLESFYV